jgi:hypothetical protein
MRNSLPINHPRVPTINKSCRCFFSEPIYNQSTPSSPKYRAISSLSAPFLSNEVLARRTRVVFYPFVGSRSIVDHGGLA